MQRLTVKENFLNGLIKNNPVFVLVLGMCPTLAMTSNIKQAIAMGLATTFVLFFSNIIISSLKKVIPDKIRIPCFIIIISTFVIIVELTMKRYLPDLYSGMKTFISLIVVNCIIFGRAESFASCNRVFDSAIDGLSMGLGFTLSLSVLGLIREFFARGTFFDIPVIINFPQMGAGATNAFGFIVLGLLMALFNQIRINIDKKNKGTNQ